MSVEPPPTSNPSRHRLALSLTVIALLIALVGFVILRRPSAPAGSGRGFQPRPVGAESPSHAANPPATADKHSPASHTANPPATADESSPASHAANPPATADKHSPAPLVAGNPLTDDRFAEISTGIVVAAIALKQDADWALNLEAYMAQQLEKAGVTQAQYNEYAEALHEHPERGQAVAENILRRVQKKVGYRIGLEKLPMFKFDPKTIKAMQEKLKR